MCSHSAVTGCNSGDGCCPPGCNANSDTDCSSTCGNGSVEAPETCDTAIPAGNPGACPASCSDGVACTTDTLSGSGCSVMCSHSPVTNCKSSDGCCPAGCLFPADTDCPCVPTSCSQAGYTCGTLASGCGQVLDCGPTCDSWQSVSQSWPTLDTYAFAMDRAGGDHAILFGGYVEGSPSAVGWTWEYVESTHTWTQHNQTGTAPSARTAHAMAYAGSGVLVMHGGTGVGNAATETWEYDAAAHTWALLSGAGGPVASSHAMSYAGNGLVLLFTTSGDTWLYERASHHWSFAQPSVPSPPPRVGHAMAWTGDGRVLLAGGKDLGTSLSLDDAWLFDVASRTWSPIPVPGVGAPTRRLGHRMAYAGGTRVLLFGGRNSDTPTSSTVARPWLFDATTGAWTDIAQPGAQPDGRQSFGMAFLGGGRVVLFGGYFYPTATIDERIRSDTWLYLSGFFDDKMAP